MKKLTSRPAFAPPFINCNLFFTLGSNLPVKVVCDSEIVLDSHFPHIMELLDEKPLKVTKNSVLIVKKQNVFI